MGRLSNNQSNELGLWEELVRKTHELEYMGTAQEAYVEFWGKTGVAITLPSARNGRPTGYTAYLDPLTHDRVLRVTWGEGNGPHSIKSFDVTRRFLRAAIENVSTSIYLASNQAEKEERERLEEADAWDALYEERGAEWAKNHFCACGHSYANHDGQYGEGRCRWCDCTEGHEELNPEQPREANVGGEPGGFKIYE
jgi:hypothetical protein